MSLPLAVLAHILVIISGWLLGAGKTATRSLVMVLISFPFWSRTFRFGESREGENKNLRLLSYNIHQLGIGIKAPQGEQSLISAEGIEWLKDLNPAIMCFQESYQSTKRNGDLAGAMKRIGYGQVIMADPPPNKKTGVQNGLAIFSKYKLKNREVKIFGGQNGMLKCDVIAGADTLTVINVHLQSMTLNLRELVEQRQMEGLKSESRKTVSRLKSGFEKRDDQIRLLEEWIEQASHPVVVCGDFNETPYGYAYGRISKLLTNSFESGGSGFGFTFRNLPYFIRIDNQFYDPDKIELAAFKTVRGVAFSDHRPVVSDYIIKKSPEK
ncbi:MAG: hypothetical protein ABS46_09835 [Cytophagaceae bacterium SCN 52-12]|nr:MAG: hypothetical protein ABS46_09835 [Cytophagaceae bacterium SCN 52-12]